MRNYNQKFRVGKFTSYNDRKLRAERKSLLRALDDEYCGYLLEEASTELRNDRKVVLACMEHNGRPQIRWMNGNAFRFASDELKTDRSFVLKVVSENGRALEHVSEELRCDREVVLQAVIGNSHYAFQYASKELRSDREFMFHAIARGADKDILEDAIFSWDAEDENYAELTWLSQAEFYALDRQVVLTAVESHGYMLSKVSEDLKNDREVVSAAVRSYGLALQYASEKLKNDRAVALAAVEQDGLALQHVSPRLRGDPVVVRAAVVQNCKAVQYVSKEFEIDSEDAVATWRACAKARHIQANEKNMQRNSKRKGPALFNIGEKNPRLPEGHAGPGSSSDADRSRVFLR